jgi:hypothetical protein
VRHFFLVPDVGIWKANTRRRADHPREEAIGSTGSSSTPSTTLQFGQNSTTISLMDNIWMHKKMEPRIPKNTGFYYNL